MRRERDAYIAELEAELEQARKEARDLTIVLKNRDIFLERIAVQEQRYRDALERLHDDPSLGRLGRAAIDDALAGKGQT